MWLCLKKRSENRVLVVLLLIGAKYLTVNRPAASHKKRLHARTILELNTCHAWAIHRSNLEQLLVFEDPCVDDP